MRPCWPFNPCGPRKARIISSQEILAAIDAYTQDPRVGPYCFPSGHRLDLAAIVEATPALDQVERAGPQEETFRNGLAIAIMEARLTPP